MSNLIFFPFSFLPFFSFYSDPRRLRGVERRAPAFLGPVSGADGTAGAGGGADATVPAS